GVATVPGATPDQNYVAFTNAEADAAGVEVARLTDPSPSGSSSGSPDQKTVLPLTLDPNDLPPDNPIAQYYQAHAAQYGSQWLEVHNAGGIVFTPDAKYAFVAGRADLVTSVTGGGFDGVGLQASQISGYLDQLQNPIYEDGNVAIIKNPLGDLNDPDPSKRP